MTSPYLSPLEDGGLACFRYRGLDAGVLGGDGVLGGVGVGEVVAEEDWLRDRHLEDNDPRLDEGENEPAPDSRQKHEENTIFTTV